MASGRRSQASAIPTAAEVMKTAGAAEKEIICVDSPVSEGEAVGLESARVLLRNRWELASVVNFLNVFGHVIGDDLKMSAEEIETGLINPDNALRKLHVTLLKGIPPVNKHLNDPDAWVTVLCKKLKEWWCWVAEGDLPLSLSNGEEIRKYKELDPVTRLLILKALCELRADQEDVVIYINNALKNGTEVSSFRKDNLGKDACGATYWCDSDAANGFRLYKGILKKESKKKQKGNGLWNKPMFNLQWETIATNLQEFRKIVHDLSSSKSPFEVAIGRTIENDALSVLERIEKRKERALKKQQRQALLLKNYRNSYAMGTTRLCRNRRPVTYTFDDYDKAIDEAIHITMKRKVIDEVSDRSKLRDNVPEKGGSSNGSQSSDADALSNSNSADSKHISEETNQHNTESDGTDEDYDVDESADQGINGVEEIGNIEEEKDPSHMLVDFTYKQFGSRWSNRLANTNGNLASRPPNATTRMLRKRPARNHIVIDSEDEGMPENET